MLQESQACIITNYSDLKKDLAEKKPTLETRNKISRSISNLNSDKLRRIYEAK